MKGLGRYRPLSLGVLNHEPMHRGDMRANRLGDQEKHRHPTLDNPPALRIPRFGLAVLVAFTSFPSGVSLDGQVVRWNDGQLDQGDLDFWVKDRKQTWVGDVDLDGLFDRDDLVSIVQTDKYGRDLFATWNEGDWNADGRFNQDDVVLALQDGGYDRGALAAVSSVPEHSSIVLLAVGSMLWAANGCDNGGSACLAWCFQRSRPTLLSLWESRALRPGEGKGACQKVGLAAPSKTLPGRYRVRPSRCAGGYVTLLNQTTLKPHDLQAGECGHFIHTNKVLAARRQRWNVSVYARPVRLLATESHDRICSVEKKLCCNALSGKAWLSSPYIRAAFASASV